MRRNRQNIFFERIFHSRSVLQELCKYAFIWFYTFLTHTKFYITSNFEYFDSNSFLIQLNIEILNSFCFFFLNEMSNDIIIIFR